MKYTYENCDTHVTFGGTIFSIDDLETGLKKRNATRATFAEDIVYNTNGNVVPNATIAQQNNLKRSAKKKAELLAAVAGMAEDAEDISGKVNRLATYAE